MSGSIRRSSSALAGHVLFTALLLWCPGARAADDPPFRIDAAAITEAVPDLPGSYHLRQPLWSPPEAPGCHLALQAYRKRGIKGIVVASDVPGQLGTGGVRRFTQYPSVPFNSATVSRAVLYIGSWFTGPQNEALLYSANANRDQTAYGSAGQSIWLDRVRLADVAGEDLSFPSHTPGTSLIVCEMGRWGKTGGDLAAFTLEDPTPQNLTKTADIAESRPVRCPLTEADVVAYLEAAPGMQMRVLNVLAAKRTANQKLVATRNFVDRGVESRNTLGLVRGFSWCPRAFRPAGRGVYGVLAYYRERQASDNPTDVRYDLWAVPVSQAGRILTGHAFKIAEDVAVENSELDPTPPAWHPDGEHLFFLKHLPGSNPLHVAHIPISAHFAEGNAVIQSWPLEVVLTNEVQLINRAVACSGDGRYLALIASGTLDEDKEAKYYARAFILPLERRQ